MIKRLFILIFSGLLFTGTAGAQTFNAGTDIVSLTIVPEYSALSSETSELTLILEGKIRPKWHLYWDNPGDTGDPIILTVETPSGFAKLKEEHSTPQKKIFEEIITSYLYSDKFYFKTLLKLEKSADFTEIPFDLKLNYTACNDSCYPEEIKVQFLLPYQEKAIPNEDYEAYAAKADGTFPRELQPTVSLNGNVAEFKIGTYILKKCGQAEFISLYPKRDILADLPLTTVHKDTLKVDFNGDELPPDFKGVLLCSKHSYFLNPTLQFPLETNSSTRLLYFIVTAFIAGLILNLMPCVLPVLSLKALSLVQQNRKESSFSALAYFTGVVCSFMLLAGILFYLRTQGTAAGWGFQLQSPVFNVMLLFLFFLIFLNLTDRLPLPEFFTDKLSRLSEGKSFLTGFFAVIIACPCTGPFMGAALGYAITQPAIIYFAIFLSLGIGYAMPYTLIEMYPQICLKYIPKPGHWILVMKRILAIPIALTCLWLGWIIYHQLNPFQPKSDEIYWETYKPETVEAALNNGQAVFIDFTAKWCLVCLVNDKTTLTSEAFKSLVQNKHIRLFKADWTNRDEFIRKALDSYGRNSIPLYVYYAKESNKPVILPQILTTDILTQYLNSKDEK